MKIFSPPNLFPQNKLEYIFLDTNIFIAALADDEFLKFILTLRKQGHIFFTIPHVVYEFARGTNSIPEYNDRVTFITGLVETIYPIDKYLQNNKYIEFTLLMRKLAKRVEYVDYLLCLCIYILPNALLFTGDHTAMPLSLFDRDQIITTDKQDEIQTFAFYSLNRVKLAKQIDQLART